MTLKTRGMMLKILLLDHRNKLHFKMYSNRKQVYFCQNITVFTVIRQNKCSHSEDTFEYFFGTTVIRIVESCFLVALNYTVYFRQNIITFSCLFILG